MRRPLLDRYVVRRADNVVHIDFERDTDPPTPTFPGSGSLRFAALLYDLSDVRGLAVTPSLTSAAA
jgi:hypothetical protein